MPKLEDLQLLITRPMNQALETQQFFAQKGLSSVCMPVMEIENFIAIDDKSKYQQEQQQIDALLAHLETYRHIIFISANAAHAAMLQLQRLNLAFPAGVTLWAIGEATAQALQTYGVHAQVAKGSFNSEALLASEALQNLDDQRVLIFRGEGGRQHLAQELQTRGAVVDYCEVYRRVAVQPEVGKLREFFAQAQEQAKTPVMLIMSVESLDALECCAKRDGVYEHCLSLPILAPGPRIQKVLQSRHYQQIIFAERANLDVMHQALSGFISS